MKLSDLDEDLKRKHILSQYEEVRKYLKHYTIEESDLEEIIQETVITAWRKAGSLRDESKMIPWIKAIAKNKVRKYYLKKGKEKNRTCAIEDSQEEIVDMGASVHEQVLCKMMSGFTDTDIFRLILDLGRPASTILILRYGYGEKFSTIAKALGMNDNTVRTIAARARKKLKIKILEKKKELL